MARKRTKRRAHVGAVNPNKAAKPVNTGNASISDPKSMVIRTGGASEVGSSISQLATDVRRVMEPNTASRLKERKANKLRDYVSMCGPLGVTHLLLFSRSPSGNSNLRLTKAPRGPTLNFRIEKYSLAKDVQRAQRHPKGGGKEYINPPLLVMNNFTSANADSKVPKHLESLITTVFQGLFPPINPQTTPLSSIRRVLLLNRETSSEEDGSFILNFRHYAITTKATGISKPLRRLNAAEKLLNPKKTKTGKGGLPDLSRLQDIADYITGGENGEGYMTDGGTSGSEAETDAEVEVLESAPKKVLSVKARAAMAGDADNDSKTHTADVEDNVERRAVKLIELGPRMRLRLTKVEEGLCDGEVMWHEFIHKSNEEIQALHKRHQARKKEKEQRRKQQKENIEKKLKSKGRGTGKEEQDEDGLDVEMDDIHSDDYSAFDSEEDV